MKFVPFKPCILPKHVRVEILHREFPVKNLYFPCIKMSKFYINIFDSNYFKQLLVLSSKVGKLFKSLNF